MVGARAVMGEWIDRQRGVKRMTDSRSASRDLGSIRIEGINGRIVQRDGEMNA